MRAQPPEVGASLRMDEEIEKVLLTAQFPLSPARTSLVLCHGLWRPEAGGFARSVALLFPCLPSGWAGFASGISPLNMRADPQTSPHLGIRLGTPVGRVDSLSVVLERLAGEKR